MPTSLPSRKRKASGTDNVIQTIENLEKELSTAVSTGLSLNPLADLLDIALETESTLHLSKALYSLYRVFVLVLSRGILSGPDRNQEARAVRTWLLERFNAFVELLAGTLKDEEMTLKVCRMIPRSMLN